MTRPLISTATMERLKAIDERAMPDTCEIRYRPAQSPNPDFGGVNEDNDATWTKATGIKCRVNAVPGPEGVVAGATVGRTDYRLSVPLGTTVSRKDRIIVKGVKVEVVGVDDLNSYSTSLQLTCESMR